MSEKEDKAARLAERRRNPMGDEAAEAALRFLVENAEAAGIAKANVVYLEHHVKIVLNRLKKSSTARSDAASETEARAHPDYQVACEAERDAIKAHEAMYWKRIAAQATIEAWRTKNANHRGADRMQ